MNADCPIVIAGAGIAGVSAAYRLQGAGEAPFVVFEKESYIGGYSRTIRRGDFRFDLGGHRFYTKKPHVEEVVRRVVGDDLLEVDRTSRILFGGRLINYPLRPLNALRSLGLRGAGKAVLDYGAMKLGNLLSGDAAEETFERWALNRFGRHLYEIYFKGYTEKTWGIPCARLSADFAEQRIKGLSFREAVKDAIFKKGQDESLVRRFLYPRYGFGQIPDGMAASIREPNRILTRRPVVGVEHDGKRIRGVVTESPDGREERQPCCEFISSIPISALAGMLRPAPPPEALQAAKDLRYRDMVVLTLFLDAAQVTPDQWIYVPSQKIGFCRFHEPKNWSPEMAPPDRTALVVEYFCQQGDETWSASDAELASRAVEDLAATGFIERDWLHDYMTFHMPKAYPVYEIGYRQSLQTLEDYLARFENLYNVGRNATFLYTSSDHYIDMGLKAAENVLGHEHDLRLIGRESGYAETLSKEE